IVVTIDIGAGQFLELRAAVDEAAGDRAELGVAMFDNGHQYGGGAARSFWSKRMGTFHDTPTVVAATFDAINLLPQILPDIAGPQLARLAIETHFPRLSQTVRPDLRPSTGHVDKGIVFWDAVSLIRPRPVHIDTQNLAR